MEGNGKSFNQKFQDSSFKIHVSRFMFQDRGQTLMELLLALGIFAFIMTAVFSLVFGGLTTGLRTEEQDFATMFAQEGLDAARSIRDTNWDTFITANDAPNTHGVVNLAAGGWAWGGDNSGTNNETTKGARKYTREIFVENVSRENGDIVQTGGTDDPHTKKITSRVKWNNGLALQDISLSEYLTDWMYSEFITNTQSDFNTAGSTSTGLTVDANGTVYLAGPITSAQTYTSAPIDMGQTSQIIKALWSVFALPAGTSLALQARTSNDGAVWGAWSTQVSLTLGDDESVLSGVANNQWVQYQIVFDPIGTGTTPVLDKITIQAKNLY